MAEFEDYFWPGTDVLANKLGIRDYYELERVEYAFTEDRQREIADGEVSIPRTFDAAHVSAVHAHLFGDLYEWAGQWRTVNMEKVGTAFAAVPWEVSAQLADAAEVAASTDWASVDRTGFVAGVAQFYAHLNHAHPFREGNGRTGKLVVDQLAERSSFEVDWSAVSASRWNTASRESIPPAYSGRRPDPASLVEVFDAITLDREGAPAAPAAEQDPELAQLFAERAQVLQSFPRSMSEQARHGAPSVGAAPDAGTPYRGARQDQGYER